MATPESALRAELSSVLVPSLVVEGYRGFRRFEVPRLAPVNLLVGPNNAGKSSLLEAVEIVCLGNVEAVLRAPARRGERRLPASLELDDEAAWQRGTRPSRTPLDLSQMFFGRNPRGGERFELTSGLRACRFRVVDSEGQQLDLEGLALGRGAAGFRYSALPDVELDAGGLSQKLSEYLESPYTARPPQVDVLFADLSQSGNPQQLRGLWDRLSLEREEENVVAALQLIEPGVERIAFVQSSPFIRLKGERRRVPLGSCGEGMKRLLALALHLSQPDNRVLLIDEIDSGLYYRVLPKMWKVVVATARRLGLQVFATTHSLDCLRALADLYRDQPELAADVLVHRIEPGASKAVTYGSDEVALAMEQDLEVR